MHVNTPHDLQDVREVIRHSPFFNDGQSSVTTMVVFNSLSPPQGGESETPDPSLPAGKRSKFSMLIGRILPVGQRIAKRVYFWKATPSPDLSTETKSAPLPPAAPPNANDSSPNAEKPAKAPSVVPPPEELPDLEEYLWNLYLAERNRRHSVAPRHVGYQTGKSWWQSPS